MAQEVFNDVDVTWTPAAGQAVTVPHTTVTFDDGAGECDTSSAADTEHTAHDGIYDPSVTVAFKGSGAGMVLGASGALAVTNAAGTLANCAIFEKSVDGSEDGAIEGSITLCPIPAA